MVGIPDWYMQLHKCTDRKYDRGLPGLVVRHPICTVCFFFSYSCWVIYNLSSISSACSRRTIKYYGQLRVSVLTSLVRSATTISSIQWRQLTKWYLNGFLEQHYLNKVIILFLLLALSRDRGTRLLQLYMR